MKMFIEKVCRDAGADFLFGKPRQILSDLVEKTESIHQKINYPLIILEYPFVYTHDRGVYNARQVKLYLCTLTKPEMTMDDRYSQNYEPILYPLYLSLEKQVIKQSLSYEIPTQRDNPFASVQIENDNTQSFPEYFDVIETIWEFSFSKINKC